MRAPAFWWLKEPNLLARLLSPAAAIYGAVTARRMAREGFAASIPVICVGNFVAGGAGKTPAAIAIAQRLYAAAETPFFLSRGYRGRAGRGPKLVDLAHDQAADVGDEALLLARIAPTISGSDRMASAKRAEELGASVLILDDGLQNPALAKDLRLALIDAEVGNGNGLCIPSGPLRAPFDVQLAYASAVVIVGAGKRGRALHDLAMALGKPVLTARFVLGAQAAADLAGRKVYGFAGIGLPLKFKSTLEEAGATVQGWTSFPDHHVYRAEDVRRLQHEARRLDAVLVTTEKDFVRIAPLIGALDPDLPQPQAVPGKLIFDDEATLDRLLLAALSARRETSRVQDFALMPRR